MAIEKPIIALFYKEIELCNIIEKYDVAECVKPKNTVELVKKLQSDKLKRIKRKKYVEK